MNSILVLGAGELGTRVLQNLARIAPEHASITVFLRSATIDSPDTSQKRAELDKLRALGIKFLRGDVVNCSDSELSTLFKPYDTVISCVGLAAGNHTQIKIARAVVDANVKRFFPWQFGVDYEVIGRGSAQDLFDIQLDVRDLLRGQTRTEWVIVSTGLFTSFLFEKFFGVVDVNQPLVRALGSWETAVTVTAPEDIGTLTADIVFAEHPRFRNEVIYTAGDTVTYSRLAEIVERVLGTKVTREEWCVPFLKHELANDPGNAIKKYRVVFAEGKGVSWPLKRTFNWLHKKPVVNVEGWLRQNLRALTT
jgi:NmrA-like family